MDQDASARTRVGRTECAMAEHRLSKHAVSGHAKSERATHQVGDIARLKRELAALEGPHADANENRQADVRENLHAIAGVIPDTGAATGTATHAGSLSFGVREIDRHLGGGLRTGRVHEFSGSAALALAVLLAGRAQSGAQDNTATHNTSAHNIGDVLWCTPASRHHGLYPPGLIALSLDPRRLIHMHTQTGDDLYWAAEEGLRTKAVRIVVIEVARAMSLTIARRLLLAAKTGAIPALVIHATAHSGTKDNTNDTTKALCPAATTRWHASHLPPENQNQNRNANRTSNQKPASTQNITNAFALKLIRNKFGALHTWQVNWDETAHRLCLASPPPNRPLDPHKFGPA